MRRIVSDAEYRRRYAVEGRQYILANRRGSRAGVISLSHPRTWVTTHDDASGYMTDHSSLTTWWRYARRIADQFGTSLKVMQPDGTWRKWSPQELVPPGENAP